MHQEHQHQHQRSCLRRGKQCILQTYKVARLTATRTGPAASNPRQHAWTAIDSLPISRKLIVEISPHTVTAEGLGELRDFTDSARRSLTRTEPRGAAGRALAAGRGWAAPPAPASRGSPASSLVLPRGLLTWAVLRYAGSWNPGRWA